LSGRKVDGQPRQGVGWGAFDAVEGIEVPEETLIKRLLVVPVAALGDIAVPVADGGDLIPLGFGSFVDAR
jgi:hypothetical protein